MEMDEEPEDYVVVPDIAGAEKAKLEGNELYKNKEYYKALDKYSEAHRLHPTSHIYLGNRAAVCLALEKYTDALHDSQEACKLDNTYIKGYSRQIKCQIALGQVAAARAVLKAASQFTEDSVEDTFKNEIVQLAQIEEHTEIAKKAEDKQDYRTASYYYKKASEIAVGCSSRKLLAAENMALHGQVPEAQALVIRILQQNGNDVYAIYVRGLCFYLEDIMDKALQHLNAALRKDSGLKKAMTLRKRVKKLQEIKQQGNDAFKAQKYEDAIRIYSEALSVDPSNKAVNSKLYYNRALARSKQRETDIEKAEERDKLVIKDCNEAIKRNDGYVKAYRKRALCHQNIDMHDEAVRDFEKILQLEQNMQNKQDVRTAKQKQKQAARKDYYKILGVSKDANQAEIKKAYRKQAMKHHPDRHSAGTEEDKTEAEKKFKDVNEAFSVLSDETKKHRYDNGQDIETGGMGGGGGMHDIDPNIIFQQFFGGQMGGFGGGMGGGRSRGGPPGGFSFSFG